jgi:membrane protein YqaA with SNARE-associated domain
VNAALASLIAVAGTLLGSLITYRFQRLSTYRAEAFARGERLREERLATYSCQRQLKTDQLTASEY